MEQNNSSDLLLVIDMQNVYTKGQEWACKGIEHASASILRLLNSQKTKQVIFTQYLATEHPDGVWKEYNKVNAAVNSDPWLNEMMPEFLPWVKTYPVFTKSVYSSFAIPEVVKAAKKARHLVISGVVAECCVLSTVLSAIDAGCKVIYLTDAVATMTAQNYGAGLIRRMNQCLLSGIGLALIFGVTVCLYSQFLPETLTAFFSKDPAVISMAAEYLKGYSIDCVIVSFVFCINSYFSGQGNSLFPMIHSLIATFLFRIPLSYWFSQIDSSSLFIMGFAPPLSTIVSLLICIWYLRYTKDKRSTTHPCYSQPS